MAKRGAEAFERRHGIYRTPKRTVSYMVGKVLPALAEGGPVLEPAAGDGVFVEELVGRGIAPERIHAYDTDPDAIDALRRLTPNASQTDFLAAAAAGPRAGFAAIIANPPYNCHESEYVRRNKGLLKRRYHQVGVLNLYSMFLYAAIESLREGGKLSFLVMDSFLTSTYHTRLRRFILDHCRIDELLLAPRRLFRSQRADVWTVIITLTRCGSRERREAHTVRLVDRLLSEEDYDDPPRVQYLAQGEFERVPEHRFLVGVPREALDLFDRIAGRLGELVPGGAGISTGNDARFLRTRGRVPSPLPPRGGGEGGRDGWVPFYKNCATHAYYFEPETLIERDCLAHAGTVPSFLARNRRFYFREGVACSSMGVKFSACYLPPGCLFGVNACFFPESRGELFALLGYLNSRLATYLLRAILNRSNMVTPGYVKQLPYLPPDSPTHRRVAALAEEITERLRRSPGADIAGRQCEIDALLFDLYGVPDPLRAEITDFTDHLMDRL